MASLCATLAAAPVARLASGKQQQRAAASSSGEPGCERWPLIASAGPRHVGQPCFSARCMAWERQPHLADSPQRRQRAWEAEGSRRAAAAAAACRLPAHPPLPATRSNGFPAGRQLRRPVRVQAVMTKEKAEMDVSKVGAAAWA